MRRKLGVLAILGGGVLALNQYTPDTFHSVYKILNTAFTGVKIAMVYKLNHESDDPQHDLHLKHCKASVYLRDALAKNGGIYIKLGQLLASLDVIIPDEYRQTLTALTRKGKLRKFSDIRKTIQEDFGESIQNVFESLEEEAMSSASIAQVHRGVLKTGEKVAVKIQHRQLSHSIDSDLMIMKLFVQIAKKTFKQFKYGWLVEQFEKNLMQELDFKLEAKNSQRTRMFLEKEKLNNVKVPLIKKTPTKRVLVMEYIDGIHVDQIAKIKTHDINLRNMGRQFAKANILMIHQEGFVHADPHSGNLMVRKNPITQKDELVILDHGLYQQLSNQDRKNYNEFWLGLILKDEIRVELAARKLGTNNGKLLCSMLTSKDYKDLKHGGNQRFDLRKEDKNEIRTRAAEYHDDILIVLNQLHREILLLLKVNEFARTIENQLGGRQMGVFEDIAFCCIRNSGLSWWRKLGLYFKIYWSHLVN